jgi:WD40 repeat protein
MKAWRNLPLEKRNALVIAVIFLFGICFALFVFRWETPPLVKLWERRHEDQPGLTHDIAFTPDGKYIVTAAQTVKVWRVEDGQQVRSFPINVKDSIGAISPDGRWVATYKIDGTITIWKILEGKIVQTLKSDKGRQGLFLSFSPDGKFLAACSHDLGNVRVWKVDDGKLLRILPLGANRVFKFAISPEGRFLATITLHYPGKQFLSLWDLTNGRKLWQENISWISVGRHYLLPVTWVERFTFSFSPNGRILVMTGMSWKGSVVALRQVSDGKVCGQIFLKGMVMVTGFPSHDSPLFLVHEDTSRDLLTPLRPRGITVPAFWVHGDILSCWRLTKTGLEKFLGSEKSRLKSSCIQRPCFFSFILTRRSFNGDCDFRWAHKGVSSFASVKGGEIEG